MDFPERKVRHQQEEPPTDTTVPGLCRDLVLCGHYRLIEWIGGGGMGEVWLAEDTAILRKCALKFLPEVLRRDEIAQERLRDEAILLARLHHPHIVTLHARESDQGFTFLVFDYVPGYEPRPGDRRQDLALHIHREQRLPEAEVRRLLPPILDAVHHAHTFHDDIVKNGIVHRDIKPRNILLDRDGRPIVTDFGIARSIQSSVSRLTGAQLHGGTLPYMSPEQIKGRPPTPRDDIYSLGMTIWEMLMGEPPFFEGDIVWRHFNDEVPAIEGVSAEMNALIQKAVAKRPEDRWQSCVETKAALVTGCVSATPTISPSVVFGYANSSKEGDTDKQNVSSETKPVHSMGPMARTWRMAAICAIALGACSLLGEFASRSRILDGPSSKLVGILLYGFIGPILIAGATSLLVEPQRFRISALFVTLWFVGYASFFVTRPIPFVVVFQGFASALWRNRQRARRSWVIFCICCGGWFLALLGSQFTYRLLDEFRAYLPDDANILCSPLVWCGALVSGLHGLIGGAAWGLSGLIRDSNDKTRQPAANRG